MKPDHYTVAAGKLLAGEYPGSFRETEAREKLRALLKLGVDFFLDLTEADEGLHPYQEILESEAAALDVTVEYRRMEIRDMSVPSLSLMRQIQQTIAAAINAGKTIYVHCLGGVGRTGTVVCCYLIEEGMCCEDAILEIGLLRVGTRNTWFDSPQTDEQRRFVLGWTREEANTKD